MQAIETTVGSVDANADPRPPYPLRKGIQVIKEAVPVESYAATLTDLRPSGTSLRGRCPVHRGDNAGAFLVDPDERRWTCFACGERGDVLDLYVAAEGGALQDAVVALATRYDVDLPRRPERWHEWSTEKGRRRDELQRWRARRYQRRFFRLFAADGIAAIEDPDERAEEMNRSWAEMGALARLWAARSMRGAE
jgi:DNA primase